jgi:hypothetical protein
MPRIFDNIEQYLLPLLKETLKLLKRADFCVGYFNLRGWSKMDEGIDRFAGGEGTCSNLTLSGLQNQGELNVDILDHDACTKLQKWFEDRWRDRWCIDISQEIVEIISDLPLSVATVRDRSPQSFSQKWGRRSRVGRVSRYSLFRRSPLLDPRRR